MNEKMKTTKCVTRVFLISALLLCLIFLQACGKNDRSALTEIENEAEEMDFGELKWPKSDIAALIPVPKSNVGRIEWEASYGFVIYVAETTQADYNAYVDDCWDRGFTIDYSRGDDYFWADNEDGYQVTVRFKEGNVMFVRMDDPPDDFQAEATQPEDSPEPVDAEKETPPEETPGAETVEEAAASAEPADGIRQEFKEAMDSYEAFLTNMRSL